VCLFVQSNGNEQTHTHTTKYKKKTHNNWMANKLCSFFFHFISFSFQYFVSQNQVWSRGMHFPKRDLKSQYAIEMCDIKALWKVAMPNGPNKFVEDERKFGTNGNGGNHYNHHNHRHYNQQQLGWFNIINVTVLSAKAVYIWANNV
jgi:hypothetical protein